MSEPPAYDDINPPFPVSPKQMPKLRPISEFPFHEPWRAMYLAWQDGDKWLCMFGGWDEMLGRFMANSGIHRTNVLAGTPTHFVDDRG